MPDGSCRRNGSIIKNSCYAMIKAIIIDDEVHCLETLSLLLNEYCPEVQVMEKCRSAKKGLEAIEKLNPTWYSWILKCR